MADRITTARATMWKGIGIGLVIGMAGTLGYLLHIAHSGGIIVQNNHNATELSYADFVAILLTAYGIIIAVAGVALAVAGIVGWNSIEAKAMAMAEKITKDNIEEEEGKLHSLIRDAVSNADSPLHNTLKAEIQRFMFEGIMDVGKDDDEPEASGPKQTRLNAKNAG